MTVLLSALACVPAPDASFADVYGAAVAELARSQRLDTPVLVHPLLGSVGTDGASRYPMQEYLAYDSSTVPAVVERVPALARLCSTNAGGRCAAPDGEPWLVLSDIVARGRDAIVLTLVHPNTPGRSDRMFAVHLRGAVVTRVEPLD